MWFVFVSLFVFLPVTAAQEVYKSTDPDGTPVFSDRNRAGATKLEIDPLPTIKARIPSSQPAGDFNDSSTITESPAYSRIVIENPGDDSVVWANGGPLTVLVTIEPVVTAGSGHAIGLRLDGKLLAVRSQRGNITLADIDRGTHTLQAVILDSSGRVVVESGTITFHLKRHSVLHKR